MKKTITSLALLFASSFVMSAEKITLYYPYSASASSTPAILSILEESNKLQDEYEFILEFKPGGNQVIAVKALEMNQAAGVALIAPAFVENHKAGLINKDDYTPVWSMGNACWVVISNLGNTATGIKSLEGTKQFNVGGVGFGNATHLTSLMLSEKFGFPTSYFVFKSNTEAVVNMAGNNGINMAIDKVETFQSLKEKGNLQALGVSCSTRLKHLPDVKTLAEQGFNAPSVFNTVVSHKNMPEQKRNSIKLILTQAATNMGKDKFMSLSGFAPPQFSNQKVENFHSTSVSNLEKLLTRFENEIRSSK